MAELTEYQQKLMKHACGIESRHPFWRNCFSAEPGSSDDLEWQELQRRELARVAREPNTWSPCRIYAVTYEGKKVLSDLTGVQNNGD